ncbi:MAG: S1 RNA-binding domain-containing protein [Oscillospiraceae bacterium]|nr:S1 RNA-binding domain-containing protein [Oscillospiraceae bacterium]MBQ3499807.1 S1 RNA-binding domain-containing protein [Oscillospiraceae bacterium]MBQ4547097.1 S1 RNA-binding domain-containing protein [Oscillospiraceae bacterium]MBQ4643322.1 S1 RNA-binding domain-containing protein [Oscillospiraceae bacterium]
MAVEIGAIVEGKVSGVTNFGVFVEIGDVTGMVHISEVARNYVKDLKEYVSVGQAVMVKVISVSPEGKISLSMKQAEEPEQREERRRPQRRDREPAKVSRGADSFEFRPKQQESLSFEDMLSKFKQSSDEKLSGMKKSDGNRRTAQSRRKPQ